VALDVTPGGPNADSYLSVADADAFAASDLGRQATKWAAASPDEKERALKRATRDLDRAARFVYSYDPDVQALKFPSRIDVDTSGNLIIPSSLEEATYEQASYVLNNADLIDDAQSRRARQLTNFAEPDVSGTVADDAAWGALAPRAKDLLEGLTSGSVVGWISTT
jgi:DnaT-like ssDNA binding protein